MFKKLFFIVLGSLLQCSSLQFLVFAKDGPPIVFVHIGKEVPGHTVCAIRQARLFNPCSEIYFIGNRATLGSFKEKLYPYNVIIVCCEDLQKTETHEQFIRVSRIDRSYDRGFWEHTTARFFLIEELMIRNNLSDLFHFENDMMIYINLADLLPKFRAHYPGLGITFAADDFCVPGFVYIHTRKALSALTKYLAVVSPKGDNECVTISRFKDKHAAHHIEYLPVLFPEYSKKYQMRGITGSTTNNPLRFSTNLESFGVLFDAASLGQYVGGRSPRNGGSKPGYVNEFAVFNVVPFVIEWKTDAQGRSIPYATFEGRTFPIANLHIHSKKLEDFLSC